MQRLALQARPPARRRRARRPPAGGRWTPGAPGSGACARCAGCSAQAARPRPRCQALEVGARRLAGWRAGHHRHAQAVARVAADGRLDADAGPRPASAVRQREVLARRPRARRCSATSASMPARVRATTIRPLVSLSSRCTMPARGKPAAAGSCASRPLSSVPLQLPGAGWTTRPAGLSITSRCSSSCTIDQRHRLGDEGLALRRRRRSSIRLLAGTHLAGRLASAPGRRPATCAGLDQLLQVAARELGHEPREPRSSRSPIRASALATALRVRRPRPRRVRRGSSACGSPTSGAAVGRRRSVDIYWSLPMQRKSTGFIARAERPRWLIVDAARTAAVAALRCWSWPERGRLAAGCDTRPDDTADTGDRPNCIEAGARAKLAAGNWERAAALREARRPRRRHAAGAAGPARTGLRPVQGGRKAQAAGHARPLHQAAPGQPGLDYALYLKGLVNFNDNLGLFSAA